MKHDISVCLFTNRGKFVMYLLTESDELSRPGYVFKYALTVGGK